jgi:hypothetical protein
VESLCPRSVRSAENFVSKKERERLEQQAADREATARIGSEHRQQRIKVLWKTLVSGSLAPRDKESADSEPLRSLVELVDLQQREIEYLTRLRRELDSIHAYHAEQQSGNLGVATLLRIGEKLRPFTRKSVPKQTSKLGPRSSYDYKRRGYNRDGVGDIERQFGLGYFLISALSPFGPNCLDEIFQAAAVNMWRLQQLFGMHRNRFPIKNLPTFKMGRERLYDYRAVVMIMDSLLSDDPPKRKASARGRPGRKWLSDRTLRARALSGIEARLKNLSAPEHIQAAFLPVVRRHLPDSAKK